MNLHPPVLGMGQAEIVDSSSRLVPRRHHQSLRKAINDKCRECIYDPKSGTGTWRQQVDTCTSYTCPLYPVRPRSQIRAELQEASAS